MKMKIVKEQKVTRTLNTPVDLWERIGQVAEENSISKNALIIAVLSDAVGYVGRKIRIGEGEADDA